MKFTKQGVRDLNSLPGKSKGIKLPEPPVPVMCKHQWDDVNPLEYPMLKCNKCGIYRDI